MRQLLASPTSLPGSRWKIKGPDLTYRELGALVARTANTFRSLGIRKGTHVGIMLPNVPQFLAGWLALARLGAMMVPINPSYTPDELHYMLSDGDAEHLLIDRARVPLLREISDRLGVPAPAAVMVWGGAADGGYHDWSIAARGRVRLKFTPSEPVDLDDIVNIQYTSGSTGFPGRLPAVAPLLANHGQGEIRALAKIRTHPVRSALLLYGADVAVLGGGVPGGRARCVPPAYSLTRLCGAGCDAIGSISAG